MDRLGGNVISTNLNIRPGICGSVVKLENPNREKVTVRMVRVVAGVGHQTLVDDILVLAKVLPSCKDRTAIVERVIEDCQKKKTVKKVS